MPTEVGIIGVISGKKMLKDTVISPELKAVTERPTWSSVIEVGLMPLIVQVESVPVVEKVVGIVVQRWGDVMAGGLPVDSLGGTLVLTTTAVIAGREAVRQIIRVIKS